MFGRPQDDEDHPVAENQLSQIAGHAGLRARHEGSMAQG